MSLKNGVGRIFDVVDLEDGESDFFACLALPDQVGNGYLLAARFVVDSSLDNVLGISFSAGYLGSVGARERCRFRTGRLTYSVQYARVHA